MKELWKKRSLKIFVALVAMAVLIIMLGGLVKSAQRKKEYQQHIEAAEKYLSELDYEQAIAEYTSALEIEPDDQEIQRALESTYLAYAESHIEVGEYLLAENILQKGYKEIHSLLLQDKLTEVQKLRQWNEENEAVSVETEELASSEIQMDQEESLSTSESVDDEEETKKPFGNQETDQVASDSSQNEEKNRIDIYIWEIQQIYLQKQNDRSWNWLLGSVTLEEDTEEYYLFKVAFTKTFTGGEVLLQVDKNTEVGTVIAHNGIPEKSAFPVGDDTGSQYNLAITEEMRSQKNALEERGRRLKEQAKSESIAYIEANWSENIGGNVELEEAIALDSDFGYYEGSPITVNLKYHEKVNLNNTYSWGITINAASGTAEIFAYDTFINDVYQSFAEMPFPATFQIDLQ